ncbi:mitogen-activated protein kinase kinase kinase 17-like [Abrus precatorius]|uniref:Mitogen-activated protein kinase kinase kinase 17-like n=1 Tax=Abrus precatorius TaxID=3816 RepID=A0A8B8MIN9_ABRPR|nr:mitogen-activated protein kinase kinase kinase 17-like [Abrus precatorius]
MASWVRGKCIGKGAFGIVNIAVSKKDGRVFAVKSVDRKTGLTVQLDALENEIRILQRVSSPHVVAFLGADVTCEEGATSSFRNLHLEYMPGGTVADLDHADVDERLVRRYAWCLVSALRHVHARGFVHCDVKGRNVLVAGDRSVAKLADFGAAVDFSGEASPRGSPMWMAPEVIRREYQGPESDVWSLGCTVIEMVTGKPAWEDRGVDTLSRIGYSNELPEFPSVLSEVGRDFLEKCLRREPNKRWSCDQLLQHPFLLPYNYSVESSPRCVLDWVDSEFAESDNECEQEEEKMIPNSKLNSEEDSVNNRICKLATGSRVNWETQGWVVVRAIASHAEPTTAGACDGVNSDDGERVNGEFRVVVRVEEAMEVGTSLEYWNWGKYEIIRNDTVNREMWKFGGRERLVWRRECDECNRNRKSFTAGRGCRYSFGWEKLGRIIGIFSIYSLCCKIFYVMFLILNILCFSITYVVYLLLHVITEKGPLCQRQNNIKKITIIIKN